MKFSIVTPVYNGERYLDDTIKSVVNQTYKNIEYIIVDGESNDGTHEIIKKYKNKISKIIIQKDKTMYEALKTGFENATGSYFCWINSDDYLLDDRSVERVIKSINKFNFEWFNCNTAIAENKQKPKIYHPLYYPNWIIKNGHANNCFWGFVQQENTIFSSDLYKKVDGINQKFKMAGDYDLWKKFSKYENLNSIKINFAVHRKSNNQLTNLDYYYKEINKRKCIINFFYPIRIIFSFIRSFFLKSI